jgi:hypothetical protein
MSPQVHVASAPAALATRRILAGGILLVVACTTAQADLLSFLSPTEPDVIANTDVFDRDTPTPSRDNPVYYLSVSKGYRNFGYDTAGEKIPDPKGVLSLITKILNGQEYRLATREHPPTIIILYSWGTFYRNADPYAQNTFVPEMLEFLGGSKVGLRTSAHRQASSELDEGLHSINPDSSTISGFIPHGMYVITFWAFDFAQARQGVARLLWKTNISSSTRGFYLPEVLPTMLAVAAPMIGRETGKPIRIDIDEHYRPRIELGPLQVIDDDVKTTKPR